MRELTSHKVNGLNDSIRINVLDAPGPANACHEYQVRCNSDPDIGCDIQFQKGVISENGINGITNESLLAIVEDRMLGFQSGQYACRENAIALTKIQEAMLWLQKRTRDRITRGVEGTNVK